MNARVLGARLVLRCCGTTYPQRTDGPCWQVYVVQTGMVREWPAYTWPTSSEVPTLEAREGALASLGFALAEGVEWEWTEDTGPEYHPHPVRVSLLAAADVRPLGNGAAE